MDDGGKFRGIKFTQGRPIDTNSNNNYTYYMLQITEQSDKGYKIVNKVRLSTDSIYFDNDTDLTAELNSKQPNLNTKNGIELDQATSTIGLTDNFNKALESISNKNVGSNTNFVYVSNGEVKASNANVGSKYTTSGNYKYTRGTYTEGGELKSGTSFFISKDSPNNTIGSNGDFWFKYTD